MPHEYANWRADVLCNDCVKRSWTRYHFLGHECSFCHGYNTAVIHLDKRPPTYVPAGADDLPAATPPAAVAQQQPPPPPGAGPAGAGASLLGSMPWLQGVINQFREGRAAGGVVDDDAGEGVDDDDEDDGESDEEEDDDEAGEDGQ